LFDSLSADALVVYNSDDKQSDKILENCKSKKYSYGTISPSDFLITNIKFDLDGTSFSVKNKGHNYDLETSLIGEFNAYNASAAFALSKLHGIKEEHILNGIKSTQQVPGRFEVLNKGNKKVIVDYSHTPDSLEKALESIGNLKQNGSKIITVFGCGGNRDKLKRPAMGKIASEHSDEVIITSDNPRFENSSSIIDDIKSGISKNNFNVIENREEAIKNAIEKSDDHAIILIAGKGHEDYQEIKGVRSHFSDREVAENYLGI